MPRPTTHQLATRREQLINLIKIRLENDDWRGVISIAIELREIEAQLQVMD